MTATITSFDKLTGQLGQRAIEGAPVEVDDRLLWSVTTIIGVLDKPALMFWSAEQAALAAVNNMATWQGMLADDDPACKHASADTCPVVKWLRDARFRKPKGIRSATQLGTDVHAAIEEYGLTGKRPDLADDDEVGPYVNRFEEWAEEFSPVYQATEVTVYHPDLNYAGTLDALLSIGERGAPKVEGTDAVHFLGDYKSTRKSVDSKGEETAPYPDQVGLQVAAYRHAKLAAVWRPRRHEKSFRRYYHLGGAEQAMAVPVPTVDTGLCIHITPEHCKAYPIRCDDEVFEAYLAAQDSARWVYQTSKTVMSPPLVATGG